MHMVLSTLFYLEFFNHRQLRRAYKEDVVRDIMSSRETEVKIDEEFQHLKEDREVLRQIFPTGNSKVLNLFLHAH